MSDNFDTVQAGACTAFSFPSDVERPAFRVLDYWTNHAGTKRRPGVWYFALDKDGEPTDTWVCSPLHVEAVSFDSQANNFGRLLRFRNSIGEWREWAMPMELLAGDGSTLRAELLAMGVEIDPTPKARSLLSTYLQWERPTRRVRCALQIGWVGNAFVLPDAVIGPDADKVIFQSGERYSDEHVTAGTLDGWKQGIAAPAIGNPILVLTLSAAFAGPLLGRCGADGGGFHFVGDSSTGKTTAVEAARSVWGGLNYRRSWHATANGMEGAAVMSNDCLLALDEIGEANPQDIGAIVYALGNGRGKQRAKRTGAAQGVARWRCIVLSSGERSLATFMAEGGQRAKAGQLVRLLDVPVARTFGAWDDIHGVRSSAAFSDALKFAANQHHGLAGRAFLEKLTHDPRDFGSMLEEAKANPVFDAGFEGQEKRAAARFALVGVAGELATEYGITGWPKGEAMRAAGEGFRLWRSARGKGNDERRQIVDAVLGFLQKHGDARFSDVVALGASVPNRAGWWRDSDGSREYLLTKDGMREAVSGFDFSRALDVMQEVGALPPPKPGSGGERASFCGVKGVRAKVYIIDPDKLDGAGLFGVQADRASGNVSAVSAVRGHAVAPFDDDGSANRAVSAVSRPSAIDCSDTGDTASNGAPGSTEPLEAQGCTSNTADTAVGAGSSL